MNVALNSTSNKRNGESFSLVRILHLWHLLSLDAPSVAGLWTWFIAATLRVRIPRFVPFAMFLMVWILYVGDRLLDGRQSHLQPFGADRLEERHHFHHRHRSAFIAGIAFTIIPLEMLLSHIPVNALHLYLILGGLLTSYFGFIHTLTCSYRLPKELLVGPFFAAAVFIPTVAHRPDLRIALLPSALLFATLCDLNCLFIYRWEHEQEENLFQRHGHAATDFAQRHLGQIVGCTILGGVVLPLLCHQAHWMIPAACASSAALLVRLHTIRRAFSPTTLRAAADFILLIPLLFLPFLPRL